jgi:CheY-like chemotaxis protein
MTGLELIKKLRSEGMTLPVILASGTVPTEELERHSRLSLDATLPKPFTIVELLDAVNRVAAGASPSAGSAPLSAVKAGVSPTTADSHGDAQPPAKPPSRILVVEDEPDARQLAVDVLAGSGYAVVAVKDGAAGWAALQSGNYDLIVTDNKMPRMSGVEMIEKLRTARMNLPVVMVTGYLPTHEYIRRPWLKPDVILEKPFSNFDLLAAVARLLLRQNGQDVRPRVRPLEQGLK